MLRVSEIFSSIQGESTHAGRPCAFVRLAGCGFGCAWCDTAYASDAPGRAIPVADAAAEALALGHPLTEITGGEPLLQEEAPRLAAALAEGGSEVLVETSGLLDITPLAPPAKRIVDLKAPSSGVADRIEWKNLARLRPGDEVKIVLADADDYRWAVETLHRYPHLPQCVPVLLGVVEGRLDAARLAEWILRDRLPVRLQIRLHRHLWPERTRGV